MIEASKKIALSVLALSAIGLLLWSRFGTHGTNRMHPSTSSGRNAPNFDQEASRFTSPSPDAGVTNSVKTASDYNSDRLGVALSRYGSLAEKSLFDLSETKEREALLRNDDLVTWAADLLTHEELPAPALRALQIGPGSILAAVTEQNPSLKTTVARLAVVDFLTDALAWKDNPATNQLWASLEKVFRVPLPPRYDGTEPARLMADPYRQLLGDKIELLAACYSVDREKAKAMRGLAVGDAEVIDEGLRRLGVNP